MTRKWLAIIVLFANLSTGLCESYNCFIKIWDNLWENWLIMKRVIQNILSLIRLFGESLRKCFETYLLLSFCLTFVYNNSFLGKNFSINKIMINMTINRQKDISKEFLVIKKSEKRHKKHTFIKPSVKRIAKFLKLFLNKLKSLWKMSMFTYIFASGTLKSILLRITFALLPLPYDSFTLRTSTAVRLRGGTLNLRSYAGLYEHRVTVLASVVASTSIWWGIFVNFITVW